MPKVLTSIPPPFLHPLPLKEEEEAVGINEYGRTGGRGGAEDGVREEEEEQQEEVVRQIKEEEEEEYSEGVTEKGKYYDIQVELPWLESDEETLMMSSPPSVTTEVTDNVTAKGTEDVTDDVIDLDPPVHMSLVSAAVMSHYDGIKTQNQMF